MNKIGLSHKLTAYLTHCKESWHEFHKKLHDLWQCFGVTFVSPSSAGSLDDIAIYQKFTYEPRILKATQWSLEDVNSELGMGTEVEVEFFPADVEVEFHQSTPYPSSSPPTTLTNPVEENVISNEEIYRKITHFPPSHRLH